MLRVLSIIGTRPEAIKMAPIIKELERYPDVLLSRVCVTAQHRYMLDQILDVFNITPDYDLNVMQKEQSLAAVASAVLTSLEPLFARETPDWVLVQGDTTTTMAASMAAFYAGIKVGHVEAGLRTYDKKQPFPEEVHRRITGITADLHFVPTERARSNLLNEQVPAETILLTGNPVIDALHTARKLAYDRETGILATLPRSKRLLLVTAHRRENIGQPLIAICRALREIARCYQNTVHIVYPVHLNPHVSETVRQYLWNVPGITLFPPLDYLPMVCLLEMSYLVLTDSGGLQEEAPSLGKPVLVLRNRTERPEAVEAGTVKLVPPTYQTLVEETSHLLDDERAYRQMAKTINPYGDGHAAERIVAALIQGIP